MHFGMPQNIENTPLLYVLKPKSATSNLNKPTQKNPNEKLWNWNSMKAYLTKTRHVSLKQMCRLTHAYQVWNDLDLQWQSYAPDKEIRTTPPPLMPPPTKVIPICHLYRRHNRQHKNDSTILLKKKIFHKSFLLGKTKSKKQMTISLLYKKNLIRESTEQMT